MAEKGPIEDTHRLVSIHILEILNKYTDREHTMCQVELMQKLKEEYDDKISRHTCSYYLAELRLAGYIMGQRGVYTPYRFSYEDVKKLYDDLVSGKTFSKEEAEQIVGYLLYPKKMELKKEIKNDSKRTNSKKSR